MAQSPDTAWYSIYSYTSKTWSFPREMTSFDADGMLFAQTSRDRATPGFKHDPVLARWTPQDGWMWQPAFMKAYVALR